MEEKAVPPISRRQFLSFVPAVMIAGCGGGSAGSDSSNDRLASTSPEPQEPPQTYGPRLNVIQLENAKSSEQGVSSAWYIEDHDHAGNGEIEGYASATSVARGDSIRLYVNTSDPTYTISIYRIGWYGGAGGRLVAGPIQRNGFRQPEPVCDAHSRLVECDWIDPFVLAIPDTTSDPTDWASGVYLAKLTGSASGKQSYIVFVVRDDARSSDLLFQSSVTTYAAYNNWGGHSFYDTDSNDAKPAFKVSFNRPYRNPQQACAGKGAGDFLGWEIMMLRFVEREGFDVSYTTNIAVHLAPERILKHRGFLSVGHDEYWTSGMRDGLECARDNGVNLGFFGANMGYWQVRMEPSRTGAPNRTVVCYKHEARRLDPAYRADPELTTFLWREQYDPPINRPEAALIGVMYDFNSVDLDMVMSDCSSWICDGTGLENGAVLKGMLGYEVDRVDPVSSPAGIQILASSPYTAPLDGHPGKYETRHANMTYYTAPSGAGVFATGSMQWNWGLDDFGPRGDRVNSAVQKMTCNVLNHFVAR